MRAHPPTRPRPPAPHAGAVPSDAVCEALTSFLHLALGLLAPVLLSIHSWRPPEGAPAAAVPQALEPGGGGGAWRRLCRGAERAARAADRQLYRLVGAAHKRGLVRLLAGWYILAK